MTANSTGSVAKKKTAPKQLTPWQKGQSGNPSGRPKEVLAPVIRRMAQEHPEDVEKLSNLIWSLAMTGDINYVKFISDRLDGPVVQRQESGPAGAFDALDHIPDGDMRKLLSVIDDRPVKRSRAS